MLNNGYITIMPLLRLTLVVLTLSGFIYLSSGCAGTTNANPRENFVGGEANPCMTPSQIERINGMSKRDRVAHIRGKAALLFVLLDPIWSHPDTESKEEFKSGREKLEKSGIDEVIIWDLPGWTLNAAVPFKNGCAVEGYGEPDYPEKQNDMHEAAIRITELGLDHPSSREAIEKLLPPESEGVDIMIKRIRPFAPHIDNK